MQNLFLSNFMSTSFDCSNSILPNVEIKSGCLNGVLMDGRIQAMKSHLSGEAESQTSQVLIHVNVLGQVDPKICLVSNGITSKEWTRRLNCTCMLFEISKIFSDLKPVYYLLFSFLIAIDYLSFGINAATTYCKYEGNEIQDVAGLWRPNIPYYAGVSA